VKGAVSLLTHSPKSDGAKKELLPIPLEGLSREEIEGIVEDLKSKETEAEDGKVFAYSYMSDSKMEDHSELLAGAFGTFSERSGVSPEFREETVKAVYASFLHSNALNPTMFPSLRKFETEVLSMTAWMLHGDEEVVGAVTSGGTESVLMAVKAYRERARKLRPHISKPNIVAPITIHPCFDKAGHFFDVEIRHCKVGSDYRAVMEDMRSLIDSNTILLVGSAPQVFIERIDISQHLFISPIFLWVLLSISMLTGWLIRLRR